MRYLLIAILIAALLPTSGCTSGPVGADLSVRPRPMDLGGRAAGGISLPTDERYSITLSSSHNERGLAGEAIGKAEVSPDGTASAEASVKDGGKAEATFRLGHSFRNDGSNQVDLDIEVELTYSYHCKASPSVDSADASVDLGLFARGEHNRLLSSFELVDHSSTQGDAAGEGREKVRFTVTLAPRERTDVFLSGVLKVENDVGRKAEASLRVEGLRMHVKQTGGGGG